MSRSDINSATLALVCSAALVATLGCTEADRTPVIPDTIEAETVPAAEVVDLVEKDPVSAAEAANRVGETLTVTGRVAGAFFLERSDRKPTFLNLDEAYPNQALTVVIFGAERGLFERPPEELFEGRLIAVTGAVQAYRDRPEIVVTQPKAIRILEEDVPEVEDAAVDPAAEEAADDTIRPPAMSMSE